MARRVVSPSPFANASALGAVVECLLRQVKLELATHTTPVAPQSRQIRCAAPFRWPAPLDTLLRGSARGPARACRANRQKALSCLSCAQKAGFA
jgi:hypothetical protein